MPNEENKPSNSESGEELETLEAQTNVVEGEGSGDAVETLDATTPESNPEAKKVKDKKRFNPVGGFAGRFNIYLLAFIFLLVLASVITGVSFMRNQQENSEAQQQLKTEPLSQEALEQLRQTDVKVGDPKQILSVESNAIFAGNILVRDNLEVAGEIKAGGSLSLPGLTVTGSSILNEAQANVLQVSGNTNLQGPVNIQNNLSVSGNGTFGGTLTAASISLESLTINGDLQFTRHLDAGGGTPSRSNGSALGAGGTSSVSGTDTAGTVAINTGGGTAPGCFATITFTQAFNGTPHVVVTPVGSAGGLVNYYINRSSTNFSICTANAAPAGQSFAFDYIVID